MAQIEGSICSMCYADKGFYKMYSKTIKPAQFSRLDSINSEYWVSGMVSAIGNDAFFRWHDSGDLQSLQHFEKIVSVCLETPNTRHWLPTREYSLIKDYVAIGKAIPSNLTVRLSAMYPNQPVKMPKSLQGIKGITVSNVHTDKPIGEVCKAPTQDGACVDCRLCWSDIVVSYALH